MPELQVPQTGETIATGSFGQPVVFRVLSRYTNAAQRDALAPSPGDGEPAWLQDVDELQIYDGTQWVTMRAITEPVTDTNFGVQCFRQDEQVTIHVVMVTSNSTYPYHFPPANGSNTLPVPLEFRPTTGKEVKCVVTDNAGGFQPDLNILLRLNPDGTWTFANGAGVTDNQPGGTGNDRMYATFSFDRRQ